MTDKSTKRYKIDQLNLKMDLTAKIMIGKSIYM